MIFQQYSFFEIGIVRAMRQEARRIAASDAVKTRQIPPIRESRSAAIRSSNACGEEVVSVDSLAEKGDAHGTRSTQSACGKRRKEG